ncbi:hypothetical protein [Actinomadura rubrisoli]|uniref:Uncharacterized protein n=1 Tax=Actinomadura rubrisoli TaxID=2530368 RepID=A0A4R5A068_9ACTN|nr:hypothetical protein [Actinomadura rubrisoli]TDD63994.1 hypothetical protein E1298_42820 [Actinomadura rubrisoli]
MAHDAARARAVSVRLRRIAACRPLHRLLVIVGLLFAGWLLGGAAHADEIPDVPSRLVEKAPLVGQAVDGVKPIGGVVQTVEKKAPRAEVSLPVAPVSSAASRVVRPKAPVVRPQHSEHVRGHVRPLRQHHRVVPRVYKVSRATTSKAPVVKHRPVPLPAPAKTDTHSAAGVLSVFGASTGLPGVPSWGPALPKVSRPRALGVLPPAVRTAADEPSFAPD